MAFLDEEETSTRLKEALDLNDLRDPQGKGVVFEVDEDELNISGAEKDADLKSFDRNQVCSNICLMSDEEDEETPEDEPYLTEMERLQKRMLQTRDSDLTPKKDGGVLKQLKTPGVGGIIPEGALVKKSNGKILTYNAKRITMQLIRLESDKQRSEKVHYNAYTDVGQPPYDSTRLRGQELKLRLGKGETIPGIELALLSMKKHELSRFLIRHDYAYGDFGCPPRIPKSATLIFDIEVLHFVEQEGVDDYYSLTPEERRAKLVFADVEKVVKAENAEAQEYFRNKNHNKAFGKYKRSQNILENYHLKNDNEEKLWKKLLLKVYMNCAICCHNLNQFGRTITYCNQVLGIDKNWVKAHYFKGKALHSLGSFKDAKVSLTIARNFEPSNTVISKALQSLARSMTDHQMFEKNMYSKMFSRPTADTETVPVSSPKSVNENKDDENEEHGTCSDAFRSLVKEQFEKFQQDSSMTEMPFPSIQITPAEIECILDVATSLGMDVRMKGTGNSTRYEVYKKAARSV